MEQYTIYCTEKQINKALELGAPIEVDFQFNSKTVIINKKAYIVPTAEQMIGWLERQRLVIIETIRVTHPIDGISWYGYKLIFPWRKEEYNEIKYNSRREATLAAIDAAFDYISKNNEL